MLPRPGDYIDIHNHGGISAPGIFMVENLMMHEDRKPVAGEGIVYSAGLHPWFVEESSMQAQLDALKKLASGPALVAIGEAGFDRLRGAPPGLQRRAFESQAAIAEECNKPLFIHCVRAWEDLIGAHRKLSPEQPWI
nr:TatD family hydrolase [Bacteroidales bacterium]